MWGNLHLPRVDCLLLHEEAVVVVLVIVVFVVVLVNFSDTIFKSKMRIVVLVSFGNYFDFGKILIISSALFCPVGFGPVSFSGIGWAPTVGVGLVWCPAWNGVQAPRFMGLFRRLST